MPINTAAAEALLGLYFQAQAVANVADNAASSPLTNLYISLHTADPGAAGDQETSECTYTGYARVAAARSGSGWTVTDNQVESAAEVAFPQATAGAETVTHFAIGTAASGAGSILFRGALTASQNVVAGTIPKFAAGALTVTLTTSS